VHFFARKHDSVSWAGACGEVSAKVNRSALSYQPKGDVMIAEKNSPNFSKIVKQTYILFTLIIAFWIIAWILKIQLDKMVGETEFGSFIYWTTAKLLIWILPSFWLIKLSGRNLNQVLNLQNYKRWLLWGVGIGFGIALIGVTRNYLNGNPILPKQFDYGLVNILIISPIFEEFLMRGSLMGNLQQTHSFVKANLISSLMFVILHMPGWFFMGSLISNITKLDGALSIFLIGLLCGYAVNRGNSVLSSMIVHFLNNLF
jgi:membrane protease YdiL (CAAX protease family)